MSDTQLNLTRYKVAIVEERATFFTVYAHGPQEAVERIQEGFGRHAGVSGPKVVRVETVDIGGFDPKPEEEDNGAASSRIILP